MESPFTSLTLSWDDALALSKAIAARPAVDLFALQTGDILMSATGTAHRIIKRTPKYVLIRDLFVRKPGDRKPRKIHLTWRSTGDYRKVKASEVIALAMYHRRARREGK